MKNTKELELAGKKVTVSELTMKEVAATLKAMEVDGAKLAAGEKVVSTLELLFGTEISGTILTACTGLTEEEIEEDFTPSDIRTLIDEVKELNAFFFATLDKLLMVQGKLQAQASLQTPAH